MCIRDRYDDVADISVPVEMIPEKLRKAFYNGDATMMLVLFDHTTSSDDSMEAIEDLRKIANEQCFIGGMTGEMCIRDSLQGAL